MMRQRLRATGRDEATEAIPPAYTEHIGAQLLHTLSTRSG